MLKKIIFENNTTTAIGPDLAQLCEAGMKLTDFDQMNDRAALAENQAIFKLKLDKAFRLAASTSPEDKKNATRLYTSLIKLLNFFPYIDHEDAISKYILGLIWRCRDSNISNIPKIFIDLEITEKISFLSIIPDDNDIYID